MARAGPLLLHHGLRCPIDKVGIRQLVCMRSRSPLILAISFSSRASSAALSISPAIGISTFIAPTSAVADSGASPGLQNCHTLQPRQKVQVVTVCLKAAQIALSSMLQQHRQRSAGSDIHLPLILRIPG